MNKHPDVLTLTEVRDLDPYTLVARMNRMSNGRNNIAVMVARRAVHTSTSSPAVYAVIASSVEVQDKLEALENPDGRHGYDVHTEAVELAAYDRKQPVLILDTTRPGHRPHVGYASGARAAARGLGPDHRWRYRYLPVSTATEVEAAQERLAPALHRLICTTKRDKNTP